MTPRSATPLLDEIGRDLTALASQGRLPRISGRHRELQQLQRVLLRRQKNNPLIVGAPGVGKTALVEGLAQKLIEADVIDDLRHLRIVEIAAASLTAGTAVRGSFETRLQKIVAEASSDPGLILFVDEIHVLIRAGAVEGGALDAANILKPALARGDIRCIGATTLDESDRFMHSDPAFERRFELLMLDEPSAAEAIDILAATKSEYEKHHQLTIHPDAIVAAVNLSIQHVHDRCLPDKAFDLLDNACVLVRLPDMANAQNSETDRVVTADTVAQALANKMAIPVQKLSEDARVKLQTLEDFLGLRVVGQPYAIAHVASSVQRAFTDLTSPNRPKGVLAFFGPTGVGKTATAKALAEFLFDSPDALIRLDMSEYKEPFAVSRLWGAPPGYVGYNDEGTFASRLRRQPYAVILLDEIEKAHPEIHDAFLQIFDEGIFTDARGRRVNARQAVFIMTSNLSNLGGTSINTDEDYAAHADTARKALTAYFKPEFVNRIDEIVLFGPLQPADLARIAQQEIDGLNRSLSRYHITIEAMPDALDLIAKDAHDPLSGARSVQRAVANDIAEPVSRAILSGQLTSGQAVRIDVDHGRLALSYSQPYLPNR